LFSLELSHIQFINYFLHVVYLFHISCHDISIVFTSLVTRTNTHLLQYYVSCFVVDYCMCVETLDIILASITLIRHLQVCTLVTTMANALSLLLINHQYKRYLVAYFCSLTCLQPMKREQHESGGDCQTNLLPASSA
jgi:hypothetical protein